MNLQSWLVAHEKKPWMFTPAQVEDPVISVVVPTYQHVDFIDQCLESIVAQRTTFPFEIIVAEDDSTDGTREKVLAWRDRHPDRVGYILQHRANNYLMQGRPTGRFNLLAAMSVVRGAYVAVCDGDDWFLDRNKLQRQWEMLEAHPEWIGVWTASMPTDFNRPRQVAGTGELGVEAVWPGNQLAMSTTLLRKRALDYLDAPYMFQSAWLDWALWLRLLRTERLPAGYIDEETAAYRVHKRSLTGRLDYRTRYETVLRIGMEHLARAPIDPLAFRELMQMYHREIRIARRNQRPPYRWIYAIPVARRLLGLWKARKRTGGGQG